MTLGDRSSVDWPIRTDWPDRFVAPYVTTAITQPQVQLLLSLARDYDELALVPDQDATTCAPFNVDASATQLYQRVEGHVQFDDCFRPSDSATSQTADK